MINKVILIILLILILIPSFAQANSVGVSPASIEIGEAMRGSLHEYYITIINPDNSDKSFYVYHNGDIKEWIELTDADSKITDRIFVPAKSSNKIKVCISIPLSAQNGKYTEEISVEEIKEESTFESMIGVGTVFIPSVRINVEVTDRQIIKGEVLSLDASDAESGSPVRIRTEFKNEGNVAINPEISVNFLKGENSVYRMNYSEKYINPMSKETITFFWNTSDAPSGFYNANADVKINNKKIYSKQVSFQIFPKEEVIKSGVFSSLTYEGIPETGNIIKIKGQFRNTGEAAVTAKMTGEVYRDNNLIESFKSEEMFVYPLEMVILTGYIEPDAEGNYLIKTNIYYGGRVSETREISIPIQNKKAQNNIPLYPEILIIAIILAFIFRVNHKLK